MIITIKFCILKLVLIRNFRFNCQFWFFGPNLPKNSISGLKWKKSEHYHWILQFRISLNTTFQLKLTILMLWAEFSQKGYFRSKTEKVNTTKEFCIFKLGYVPNFTLIKQIWILGTNLLKKGYFRLKTEKVNIYIGF